MIELASKLRRKFNQKVIFDCNRNPSNSVLVAGVGRSGTTWIADIINHDNAYRDIFEPFLPGRVREASAFEYHQYLRPGADMPQLAQAARTIVAGRVRNPWTDSSNRKTLVTRRIIKEIRANLMLAWLHARFPAMPIVFVLRHPCAVAASWHKLGWGREIGGQRSDLEACLAQSQLVADFLAPFQERLASVHDPIEHHVCMWCILNHVPLHQFRRGDLHLVFYENMCRQPEAEVARLFAFLGRRLDDDVFARLRRPSWQSRDDSAIVTGASLIGGWRAGLDTGHLSVAADLLALFGLDGIYHTDDPLPNGAAAQSLLRDPDDRAFRQTA